MLIESFRSLNIAPMLLNESLAIPIRFLISDLLLPSVVILTRRCVEEETCSKVSLPNLRMKVDSGDYLVTSIE